MVTRCICPLRQDIRWSMLSYELAVVHILRVGGRSRPFKHAFEDAHTLPITLSEFSPVIIRLAHLLVFSNLLSP